MENKYESAQQCARQINASGGVQSGESVEDLVSAVLGGPDAVVAALVRDALNSDGTIGAIVDPADAAARSRAIAAKVARY